LEYGSKLNALRAEVADQMEIVNGEFILRNAHDDWLEGLDHDPHLNEVMDIDTDLKKARKLLLDLTSMGLPTATSP